MGVIYQKKNEKDLQFAPSENLIHNLNAANICDLDEYLEELGLKRVWDKITNCYRITCIEV